MLADDDDSSVFSGVDGALGADRLGDGCFDWDAKVVSDSPALSTTSTTRPWTGQQAEERGEISVVWLVQYPVSTPSTAMTERLNARH